MTARLSVVIIEDSQAERFFLRRAVLKCRPDAEVTEFDYAAKALDHLRQQPAHMVFVDINMPRMDGFAFADAFARQNSDRNAMTRIWMVSHSIDPADRNMAETHPAIAGFLPKTYELEDLERVLPHIARG